MASGVIVISPVLQEYESSIPETIFHYTSPEGLIGIVTNSELWFSRFDCMNDALEGKYIIEVYEKTLDSLKGTYDDAFLDQIRNIKPDYHKYFKLRNSPVTKTENTESYYVVPVNTTPFICCFSLKEDSLPMWNYYSKFGQYEGYNIGFHVERLKNKLKNVEIKKCIYDEADQIEVLRNFIAGSYENYSVHMHSIEHIRMGLAAILSTLGMQFKDKVFEHESEVRMVYWRPDINEQIESEGVPLNYRQKKGIIIPYVKHKIDLKETIESIKIGPLIKADIAEATVKDMMKEKGIVPLISQSNVSIRY